MLPAAPTSPPDPAAEIRALGGDPAFRSAYLDGAHPGHAAAVDRMVALHERQAGATTPTEAKPTAPAPSSPGTPAAPGGRYRPEDYTLSMTIDAAASPAVAVEVQAEARQLAAALDLEPELARGGSEILDRAIASRAGRAMDAAELARLDALLARQLGPDLDAALDRFEARLKAAGPRADTMRRLILASGAEAAAWAVASLGTPAR
jgi:hypothetical protein